MGPALAQLATMKGLTDDEKNALLGLSDGTPTFDELTKAAGHYGLSLDSLGGKVGQLSISHEADQIATDYDELVTKSGADSDKVLAGMKGSLNDLVNHALKAGAVLPTSMKPLVEQLFKTGQLTDEAGVKLDTLSGLKFDDTGDPLAKGLSTLTEALNRLGDLLDPNSPHGLAAKATATAAGIGTALGGVKAPDLTVHVGFQVDNAPDFSDRTIHVGYEVDGSPDNNYAAMGGYVGSNGIQYLAGGGRVLGWKSRGSDTVPAMLTPGEGVVNRRGMASLGKAGLAALNRGGGLDGSSGPIHTHVYLNGREIAEAVTQEQNSSYRLKRKVRAA